MTSSSGAFEQQWTISVSPRWSPPTILATPPSTFFGISCADLLPSNRCIAWPASCIPLRTIVPFGKDGAPFITIQSGSWRRFLFCRLSNGLLAVCPRKHRRRWIVFPRQSMSISGTFQNLRFRLSSAEPRTGSGCIWSFWNPSPKRLPFSFNEFFLLAHRRSSLCSRMMVSGPQMAKPIPDQTALRTIQ